VIASATTSRADELRAYMQAKGVPEAKIQAALQAGGYDTGGNGGGIGRTVGLTGRANVQALGNVVGLPFGMAGAAYQGITGNQPPQFLQPQGQAAADQMGLPSPQNPSERIGVAGAEGMAMALPFMATGGVTAAGGALQMASGAAQGAGTQALGENGVGPLGQALGGAVMGGLPLVGIALAGALRAALAGSAANREASRQALALVQAGNPQAAVTLGQVAAGGAARTLEGGFRNVPGAQGVFTRTLDRQAAEMGQRVEGAAGKMGRAAPAEVVGATIKRGIEEGFMPAFKAKYRQMLDEIYAVVPPDTKTVPAHSLVIAKEYAEEAGRAGQLQEHINNPTMRTILGDLAAEAEASPAGITFGTMRSIRTRLGKLSDGTELAPNIDTGEAQRLYGALSEDMGSAVLETAGPEAFKAWQRSNLYYSKGMDRVKNVLDPLIRKRVPEQVIGALMSGTKAGATALRSTLRSLNAEEQGLVRSNALREIGKMPDETFSPELFLRKWRDLAPTAREALFEGEPRMGANLTALAQVAANRKAAGRVMFNASGTAPNVAFFRILNGLAHIVPAGIGAMAGSGAGPLGAAIGAAAGDLAAAGGANVLARGIFTRPKTIEWLLKQTRVPAGALPQQLAILAKDSQKWENPEDRQLASDLVSVLGNIDWGPIMLATAVADAAR
jgi:hypothetical protein